MINVNSFICLSDNETIENAMKNRQRNGIIIISPRVSDIEPERDYWLLERAILIPENTTVILHNCTIKLSDRCRDNFFRSANCGMGISYPEKIQNIHIRGEGLCILQGADHPRATGDSSKILACPCPYEAEDLCRLADWIPEEQRKSGKLNFMDMHNHSYGTDAGKENESQYGDWRGIGILFANVENFSIENLRIVESHGWGISLENCANGHVGKIHFDACMSKIIDGMLHNIENQDGIDLRNGCHHIIISDITGRTGDDLIALTAIADDNVPPERIPGGLPNETHVMHNDWAKREKGIHDILIRNVIGYSQLCFIIRLLSCNSKIQNVIIDGVIDTAPANVHHFGAVLIGEPDTGYGKNLPDGVTNIAISNVICNSNEAIIVAGYLKDSVITNIINRNPDCSVISVKRKNGLVNLKTSNLSTLGDEIVFE